MQEVSQTSDISIFASGKMTGQERAKFYEGLTFPASRAPVPPDGGGVSSVGSYQFASWLIRQEEIVFSSSGVK